MTDPRDVHLAIREKRNVDRLIASLAERQHGVLARSQLLRAGVDRNAVDRRIDRRVLQAVHRGVYAFGRRALTPHGRWMAAVLAAGTEAVLSHRSAAALWGLRPPGHVDVTVRGQNRPLKGVRFHRSRLPGDEVTCVEGIPVTTVPRTLLDLAAILRPRHLERAMNEAEIQRLSDPLSLPDLLARYPRRAGAPLLRTVLARLEGDRCITRSELEECFLAFIAESRLPRPEVNAWLQITGNWIECDCVWRSQRVIAELDGRAVHGTADAFEADRARDRRLQAHGWRTLRVTWRQLQEDSQALIGDLRAILGRPSL